MEDFKNYLLNEISLSRVWQHANNEKIPFSIITAFRGEYTLKQNINRNKDLASKIKKEGYGYFYLDGHWIENEGQENEIDVAEKSIFIIGDENDNGKLLGLVKKWNKEYNQDACIFKADNSKEVELIFQDGKREKVGQFKPNVVSQAYSKIKGGRTFIFEGASNSADNWISKLAYSKKGKTNEI